MLHKYFKKNKLLWHVELFMQHGDMINDGWHCLPQGKALCHLKNNIILYSPLTFLKFIYMSITTKSIW